ncbi:MAG: hypothetical protein HYR67_02285 [Bacteroidetes bacterium]|nr:hypothetical protein [Bacteroidota bacterium]
MTESIQDTLLQNREEAGLILGRKLKEYEKTNAVVIGIPRSGVIVAAAIANYLTLPLEIMPCQRIKHPANDNKNLGSVSLTEAFLPDCIECIPRDFVAHQIAFSKNANLFEYNFYHRDRPPLPFKYKTLIVVDDLLISGETMLACLQEIKKQNPLKIIVAVPIVSAKAAQMVRAEVDDMLFLKMEPEVGSAKEYFIEWERIDRNKVKKLLDASKKNTG